MSKNNPENPLLHSEFIETTNGYIHKNDIPFVMDEPFSYKFGKSMLFYSVFIIAFAVVIYIIYAQEYHEKAVKAIRSSYLMNEGRQPIKVLSSEEVQTIKVYNYTASFPLEHIVLIDNHGNVIDIDIQRNYFVNHSKIGPHKAGDLYSIDFGSPRRVVEVVLMVDPDKLNERTGFVLELFDSAGIKVWSHYDLISKKEISIPIYKEVYASSSESIEDKISAGLNHYERLPGSAGSSYSSLSDQELMLFNENSLATKLREDGNDEYTMY